MTVYIFPVWATTVKHNVCVWVYCLPTSNKVVPTNSLVLPWVPVTTPWDRPDPQIPSFKVDRELVVAPFHLVPFVEAPPVAAPINTTSCTSVLWPLDACTERIDCRNLKE